MVILAGRFRLMCWALVKTTFEQAPMPVYVCRLVPTVSRYSYTSVDKVEQMSYVRALIPDSKELEALVMNLNPIGFLWDFRVIRMSGKGPSWEYLARAGCTLASEATRASAISLSLSGTSSKSGLPEPWDYQMLGHGRADES